MSLQITIPIAALRSPGVARALDQLLVALKAMDNDASPTRAAPSPVAAKATTAAAALRGVRPSKAPAADRWVAFVDSLPSASHRFLELLEARGRLTIHEAMEALDLKEARAVGGIAGAIARWAPARGVPLPYATGETESGERCWIWNGTRQA